MNLYAGLITITHYTMCDSLLVRVRLLAYGNSSSIVAALPICFSSRIYQNCYSITRIITSRPRILPKGHIARGAPKIAFSLSP